MKKKLFKIKIGLLDNDGFEVFAVDSKNVISDTAPNAIKRVRLRKGEFIYEVEMISVIDKI